MAFPSLCVECSRRLRDAIFCPYCGASACCWDCYVRHHAAQHARIQPLHENPIAHDAAPAAGLDYRASLKDA